MCNIITELLSGENNKLNKVKTRISLLTAPVELIFKDNLNNEIEQETRYLSELTIIHCLVDHFIEL